MKVAFCRELEVPDGVPRIQVGAPCPVCPPSRDEGRVYSLPPHIEKVWLVRRVYQCSAGVLHDMPAEWYEIAMDRPVVVVHRGNKLERLEQEEA